MYATFKGSGIDAVLYSGIRIGVPYPKWFVREFIDAEFHYIDVDDTLCLQVISDDEGSDTFEELFITPGTTVILKNRFGDIRYVDIEQFNEVYQYIGPHRAALKRDCVEYFVFTERTLKSSPEWIDRLIKNRFIVLSKDFGTNKFYGEDGEYAMSKISIFIRSYEGSVRYLEPGEFFNHFDATYPYDIF